MKCKQICEKIEKLRVFFEAFNKSDQNISYATKEGREKERTIFKVATFLKSNFDDVIRKILPNSNSLPLIFIEKESKGHENFSNTQIVL